MRCWSLFSIPWCVVRTCLLSFNNTRSSCVGFEIFLLLLTSKLKIEWLCLSQIMNCVFSKPVYTAALLRISSIKQRL